MMQPSRSSSPAPFASKLAYLGHPDLGGTYTVYRLLRDGFAVYGVELRWLNVVSRAQIAPAHPAWASELQFGEEVVAGPDSGDHGLAVTLARAIEQSEYQGVFVNVLTGLAEMNSIRYLRPEVPRVMVVHNITPGTYAAARALRQHVHATIGVSPRIRDDLVQHHGFPVDRCVTIGHGLTTAVHAASLRSRSCSGVLRLIYLGRVEDSAKGVFWLPEIVNRLDFPARLTVAGDGPDLAVLRQRCDRLADRVRFLGGVPPGRVLELLAQHDAMLAPSRYEGFGLNLIEAMATGCVPVTSRIAGVTDWIIDDGRTGLLFPIGDLNAAARTLRTLMDPGRLRAMSDAARTCARERFTVEVMASRYLEVVRSIRAAPPPIAPPLDPDQWELPKGMRPGLRTLLPAPVKNVLRVARERFAG